MLQRFGTTIIYSIAMLVISSFAGVLNGRWATFDDAVSHIDLMETTVYVHKDGTVEETSEVYVTILKEPAREDYAKKVIRYNAACNELKIVEAKTIFNGKEYNVAPEFIEDKPLASSTSGFDAERQIIIAYPKSEIGSKVMLKIKRISKPLLEGHYFEELFLGHAPILSAHCHIDSEIPLSVFTNDPDKVLSLSQMVTDNLFSFDIAIKRPFFKATIDEPEDAIFSEHDETKVVLSSLGSWTLFGQILAKDYEAILEQPLPPDFLTIAQAAKEITNEIEQLNVVTALLAEKVHYLGDWKSTRGQFIPHDLHIIAQNQLGDCKDFAAATTAILRYLGYNAHVVLVRRGVKRLSSSNPVPTMGHFNHAMVKAVTKLGKTYWIDPTNFVSMADGIFPDIAGKKTLVIDRELPSYEQIPSVDPNHALVESEDEIELEGNNDIRNTGITRWRGEAGAPLTGSLLLDSSKSVEDMLFRKVSGEHLEEADKLKCKFSDLSSRIVNEIKFEYSYKQKNGVIISNRGPARMLHLPRMMQKFIGIPPHQVSGMYIGSPHTYHEKTLFKNAQGSGASALNIDLDTKWLAVKRICRDTPQGLMIDDTVVLKVAFIDSQDVKTQEFRNLRNILKSHDQSLIVFDKPVGKEVSQEEKEQKFSSEILV